MSAEKFQPRGEEMISKSKLDELAERTRSLMAREFRTAQDAIPQVLNGAGLNGRSENDKLKRNAYAKALRRALENQAA